MLQVKSDTSCMSVKGVGLKLVGSSVTICKENELENKGTRNGRRLFS